MSEINPININNQQNDVQNPNGVDIKTENIDSVFTTTSLEKSRDKLDNTYNNVSLDEESASNAKAFYNGLVNNKESLCRDLNLTSEEYDALSCVALSIASQETGMGLEKNYVEENNGSPIDIARDIGIALKNVFGEKGSASSGLTQMKIYDLMSGQNAETKALFEKYGIEAKSKIKDNLYKNPDKAAVATMIMLSQYASKGYSDYKNMLSNYHNEVRQNLDSNLSDEECLNKGIETLTALQDAYSNLPEGKQEEFRELFKDWLMSYNGSEKNLKYVVQHHKLKDVFYNEEANLKDFNKLLKKSGIQLEQKDLDYMRYAMTSDGAQMTSSEYCAYAWNNGLSDFASKLDTMLSAKLGDFFPSEHLNKEFYTYNTEMLVEKYAQKAGVDIDTLNYVLENYANKR